MQPVTSYIANEWDKSVTPALCEYVKVPNQSPAFDAAWATNGLQEKAMKVLTDWIKTQPVKGMTMDLYSDKGRTPFLFIEIAATNPAVTGDSTVYMYGHMDKQPPLTEQWSGGLDPYTPTIRDGKLYGRAAADDGYSTFTALLSIVALQQRGIPHARIVITIEGCEESGVADLEYYIAKLKHRMGKIDLVVCLDSGALNYDQLWLTNSLRGSTAGVLTVKVLNEGMHSGIAGGVVPDSFRIARQLIDRIEDPATGKLRLPEAYCEVPEAVKKQLKGLNALGDAMPKQYNTVKGMDYIDYDNYEMALRNFWGPSVTVIGANLPTIANAGAVLRTDTQLKLSIRAPPLADAKRLAAVVKKTLEANPPYGCHVEYKITSAASGWSMPPLRPWLAAALEASSQDVFKRPLGVTGLGFSVPFMNTLQSMYPEAQFVVTGIEGPGCNAHGPNEFLSLPYVKSVTACLAQIVKAHCDEHAGKNKRSHL